eukprot:gene211-827_t
MKAYAFVVFSLFAAHYVSAAATCERRWKKVGCFDDHLDPRPLPQELVNRRDPYNHNYDGHMIDWNDYPGTLHALYCKCAELTEQKGFSHFGLQFYGECWSGPSAEERYAMQGPSSYCLGVDYKPCVDKAETECVGQAATNYIYELVKNESKTVIDGGYTNWTPWTPCSSTCGGGFRQRTRKCTNPLPSKGGNDCSKLGDSEQMETCGNTACKKSCNKAIELGIIMDASSSVEYDNYLKVKEFIKTLSDSFTISTAGTHFGILHYSGRARLDFVPADTKYHNRIALKAKIDSIIYSYGNTRTDLALRMAEQKFFCPSCCRQDIPKDKKVTVMSFGIGKDISSSELETIASEPKSDHVFHIDSFDKLKGKLDDILDMACATTI